MTLIAGWQGECTEMIFQMIHTFEGFLGEQQKDGTDLVLGKNDESLIAETAGAVLQERLNQLKRCGIEGLVVNLGRAGYLETLEGLDLFLQGVRAALDMGFRLWIYDEKGYPSGSAGGQVLKNHRELEAMGIKYNGGSYTISPLYEWTHPSRSFGEKRRYINLLHSDAVRRFIEMTHLRYASVMPAELFEPIEAFFTDEPSLMAREPWRGIPSA